MERSALFPQRCDGSLTIAVHPNRLGSTCGIASRANRDAMEIAASLPIAALLHDVWKDSTKQALAHARASKHDVSTRTACSTPHISGFPRVFSLPGSPACKPFVAIAKAIGRRIAPLR
ncbi:hypothetical protein FHY29_004138 [Xanthomonas arboricola]|uniref:hypothetical protein n=1 Tax=Xanthomonas arboricola TaxID=56448 RepID=UPI0011B077BF|nr:hypothetical protein [Xanthomonas arboricola]